MEERLLLFTLAGQGFALDLQEVAEVMEPPTSYPIPRAPAHFVGLMNFHGNLTALIDLGLYLGFNRRPIAQGKVLVLDTRLASLALWVDGVSAVVAGSTVTGRTPGTDDLTAEFLETGQGSVRLLRVEVLLDALEQGL
jgi:purine-binding chemotaxis protein CheW